VAIDSRITHEVWQFLIYDEVLSRAVFDGSYRELAARRGYSADQIAVLDWFAAQPGMRWNVENLRFRAALETAACLQIHIPKTARLLTRGDDDWLQDICYEYLSYYSWDALGHRRLTECIRFAAYCRERIMKRRITPPHLDLVLELELATVEVMRATADVVAWPKPPAAEIDLAPLAPRRAITQRLVSQPVDLRPFMRTEKALEVVVEQRPVTWLVHLGSPAENPHMKVVSDGVREVLVRCTGEATVREIAAAMEREHELPPSEVTKLMRRWLDDGTLVVA
jgi:hypothetical protein